MKTDNKIFWVEPKDPKVTRLVRGNSVIDFKDGPQEVDESTYQIHRETLKKTRKPEKPSKNHEKKEG